VTSLQPIPFSFDHGDPDAPCLRRLPGTCDLLQLHRLAPERYPFLLESAAHGTPQARYDILFAFPGETLELAGDGRLTGGMGPAGRGDFLSTFNTWWQHERIKTGGDPSLPPFRGGWFVYIGYELAGQIEPTLRVPVAPGSLPVAFATRIPAAVVFDHTRQEICLVAENGGEDLLAAMTADLEQARAPAERTDHDPCLDGSLDEEDPERYLAGVRRVIEYVRAGDVFQVNLSRVWRGRLKPGTTHADVYDRLRRRNPSPFAGLVRLGNRAIISSSPERLVKVAGRMVQTRPIAGTRPRGSSGLTDVALSEELIAHPKERAEHIMLVDLERNDLSRVCVPGSVKVSERMVIESYAQVHHIVSNIQGQLREGVKPGDVVRAIFPGGTITGCPKVRCMEIIAELEQVGRGAYTGSMGYINRDGGMDLNILIRTIVAEGDEISLRAGAGIVADSIPERELEETEAKARALVMALVTES
jgi:anthranilate synthase component 1